MLVYILAGAVTGFAGAGISVMVRRRRMRLCECGHPRRVHGLYRDAECAMCGCRKFTAA